MENYYEKNLVINNRELKYKGRFRFDKLVSAMNKVLEEKGYHKREKKSEEIVTEEGRKTIIELRPYKDKSNYVKHLIKIKIDLDQAVEAIEEINNVKEKFDQGNLTITFDAWSLTDYYNRWGMKPWVYFIKGLFNKYIYSLPLESGFMGDLKKDTAEIYSLVKKHLTSYEDAHEKPIDEDEVRKQVEVEIERAIE
jgi:hypothetical protein